MVKLSIQRRCTRAGLFVLCLVMTAAAGNMSGCEVDSFFDPSRTGRFEKYPTTIPILDRLDVIERQVDFFSNASPATTDDLLPRDLSYFLYPGDAITVGIYELYQQNVWSNVTRRIDAGGYYRVPELGEVRAAGMTVQQFEDELIRQLKDKVIVNPQVDVVVEQSGGLRYTIYGFVQTPGVFNLQSPDLRLLDALAIAGGVPLSTERIYVVRQVILSEDIIPSYDKENRQPAPTTRPDGANPADIEDLIDQLDKDKTAAPPRVSPGMLAQQTPPVDIDQLEPAKLPKRPAPVDVDSVVPPTRPSDDTGDTFMYDQERGEWVRVPIGSVKRPGTKPVKPAGPLSQTPATDPELIVERVVRVDYQLLAHGDSSQNIVIRPGDSIYVDGPPQGVIYIEGEVNRPGVYQLPQNGVMTLSRLVAATGGLGAVAIPQRVDLTRKIGHLREATIRLDLAAIRQRTEPDVVLKPDDHIIVGTNFIATPLAILRNGFRATYGFGFILDRNFGPDVFGAQPQEFN